MSRHGSDDSWVGILFVAGAILFQLYSALRKGKTAQPPSPLPPGTSRSRVPAPMPQPWRPAPVAVPPPAHSEASALPSSLQELFEELSGPPPEEPEPLPVPASATVPDEASIAAAVRAMEAAESSTASAPPAAPSAWARLRVRNRAEWQRAFVLSEVLQAPVALRPDGFARTAHF